MIEILLQAERQLTVGMVDHAERLFAQVLEADPRNGIAVVGLARVALERGDETDAYRLAARALELDPENAAAQRLTTRLAEVFAHRGQPPPPEVKASAPSSPNGAIRSDGSSPKSGARPKTGARRLIGRLLGRGR
jgi:thioredoxin-like negative regulator of GroEL